MISLTGMDISMASNPDLVYLTLWPLVLVGIWAIWNMVRDSRNEKLMERSLAWPEAQGRVVSSKVVWAHVEVTYEYSISGGHYIGKYKMNLPPGPPDNFGRTATRMMEEARQDIADFPAGAEVIIRYNPEQPEQSVLYCRGEICRNNTGQGSSVAPKFLTLS
jgi:hypothetical protein